MSEHRPSQLDDEPDVDFSSLSLDRKVDYLFVSQTETLKHYEDQLRKQQNALAGVLAEIAAHQVKVDGLMKEVVENTKASNRIHELVANYALDVRDTMTKMDTRLKRLEDSELDPGAIGKLIGDIEKLNKAIENERSAREKQDSIHDDVITSTKNRVVEVGVKVEEAGAIAKDAKETADKAVTLADKVKSQITPQNATKAGLTALALAVIEAFIKNWDSVKGFFHLCPSGTLSKATLLV